MTWNLTDLNQTFILESLPYAAVLTEPQDFICHMALMMSFSEGGWVKCDKHLRVFCVLGA